jgi:DNA-binding response OmpR family regulator/DNA-binding CsgD family transcriptional regulator
VATILVVDDEPDIRELIRLNLEFEGHRVTAAADGSEALRMLGREVPDLVLLDLAMPELDGWAVLAAMKGRDDDVSRTPVLMLTAHDSVDNRIRGGIEGALRCLPKPFRLDQLRQAVDDALGGGPEPAQRRRAQAAALEELARQERGGDVADAGAPPRVRPHLTRLEHRRAEPPTASGGPSDARRAVGQLTDKQRAMLRQLATSSSVSAAADELGVSRSNIYASLRRVARKLNVASVPEVVMLVRDGDLLDDPAP